MWTRPKRGDLVCKRNIIFALILGMMSWNMGYSQNSQNNPTINTAFPINSDSPWKYFLTIANPYSLTYLNTGNIISNSAKDKVSTVWIRIYMINEKQLFLLKCKINKPMREVMVVEDICYDLRTAAKLGNVPISNKWEPIITESTFGALLKVLKYLE